MKVNYSRILLSPLFLLSLFLLLLNDFYLKAQFGNFITGKLSDFAGLFVFPLFFSAFLPKRKLEIYILTGFLFIFWKSPYSQSLINFWNIFGILKIGRTVDFTDLSALLILPVSFVYLSLKTKQEEIYSMLLVKKIATSLIIVLSVFAFTATSLVKERTIMFHENEYKFSLKKEEVERILKNTKTFYDLAIQRDDEVFPRNQYPNIEVDLKTFFVDLYLEHRICESRGVKFTFIMNQEKDFTKIWGISAYFNCSLYEDNSINHEELAEQQKKELLALFEREVIEKLRQNSSQ